MRVLAYLNIDASRNTVAFIMNADSKKHGRKDLIKIANITDVDLTVLGLIDHNATVNIIEDRKIVKKIKLRLPETVTDVIKCKNPRCVTSSESVPHIFRLVDEEAKEYRCEYCDEIVKAGEY
jgi:aspartate carbamoyltransferase regulatory subunit